MKKRLECFVSGRVQGVMFRKFVESKCLPLDVYGYVENLGDGRVHFVVEGKEEDLLVLLSQVKKGSLFSRVDNVEVFWSQGKSEFKDFKLVRDQNIYLDQRNALFNLRKFFFTKKEGVLQVDTSHNLPKHVVIIPDGNRRWAKSKGLPAFLGHKEGSQRVKEILQSLKDGGVESLTLWLFSTENWKREKEEVEQLMGLFEEFFTTIKRTCLEEKIYFRHFGRKDRLNDKITSFISELENETGIFKDQTPFKNLNLAIDYGGRDEVIRAINKMGDGEKSGEINEETFEKYLDTCGIPDPDLVIRTSGEMRLSGMMPYQTVYSELYFTEKHFPDFTVSEFKKALNEFSNRKRRFGK